MTNEMRHSMNCRRKDTNDILDMLFRCILDCTFDFRLLLTMMMMMMVVVDVVHINSLCNIMIL